VASSLSSRDRAEPRILVVEDNDALRRGLAISLEERFGDVDEQGNGQAAVAHLADPKSPVYDLVLTDLRLPGADGIAVLRAALERATSTAVIVMSAYANIDTAVEAMRIGACDFVQKPFDPGHLELRVARALEPTARRASTEVESVATGASSEDMVCESPSMRRAVELAVQIAETRSTVLITGETGTGKELIAGLIHARSPRAPEAFVKVNCAALPETLLESELFGHERGAFTGADRRRVGRFEEASGGTLFLDEIGDITVATQAKLLRVLQDQEFHRLGGTRALRTDARLVAATNRDLGEAIRAGTFRQDLYYRLDVIGIHLPPLRERPEDLTALCDRTIRELARDFGKSVTGLTADAWSRIRAHRWPGNVRELRNVLERAVLTTSTSRIGVADLALGVGGVVAASYAPSLPPDGVALDQAERALVVAALERAEWVQKDAAALLRVSRRKLNYMVQKMGITHPSWRRNRGPVGSSPERCRD
jgi:DNA-binding NtrC family response regulator